MNSIEKAGTFLESIIKGIVNNPESVKVVQETDNMGMKLVVSVAKEDMGKLIGSQGRMASSLRTIMHGYGGMFNQKLSVLIEDDERQ